jgi:hypothetical protein
MSGIKPKRRYTVRDMRQTGGGSGPPSAPQPAQVGYRTGLGCATRSPQNHESDLNRLGVTISASKNGPLRSYDRSA